MALLLLFWEYPELQESGEGLALNLFWKNSSTMEVGMKILDMWNGVPVRYVFQSTVVATCSPFPCRAFWYHMERGSPAAARRSDNPLLEKLCEFFFSCLQTLRRQPAGTEKYRFTGGYNMVLYCSCLDWNSRIRGTEGRKLVKKAQVS